MLGWELHYSILVVKLPYAFQGSLLNKIIFGHLFPCIVISNWWDLLAREISLPFNSFSSPFPTIPWPWPEASCVCWDERSFSHSYPSLCSLPRSPIGRLTAHASYWPITLRHCRLMWPSVSTSKRRTRTDHRPAWWTVWCKSSPSSSSWWRGMLWLSCCCGCWPRRPASSGTRTTQAGSALPSSPGLSLKYLRFLPSEREMVNVSK